MRKSSIVVLSALLMSLTFTAEAKMGIKKKFAAAYPKSTLTDCMTCHVEENEYTLNSYGTDLNDNGLNFKAVEALDSDTDGATNIAEINAGTNPGDMSSVPVL